MLTVLPHALLELTAVFLPLAAWTIASRRDEWDQLLAATAVTVTIAIPMLIASAAWEVHVWPHLLRAASPVRPSRAQTSWSMVHSLGFLSSRQRTILEPWRMRPPLVWS